MDFLKQLDGNRHIANSREKVYLNVKFHERFGAFLEALKREKLIGDDTRVAVERGHRWADSRREGGILIITDKHPQISKEAFRIIVGGTPATFELFEHVLSRYATYGLREDVVPEEDIEDIAEYHERLNPMLWDEYDHEFRLKEDVRKKMLDIANIFLKYLKMPEMEVLDIIFTGSNANFNWTEHSDVDIHIIVDMNQAAGRYGSIIPEYLETKRRLWNEQHEVKMLTSDVEIYVQDEQEAHTSTGIYSLKNDEWVVQPKHEEPKYDSLDVRTKAAKYADQIDDMTNAEHCDPKRADEMMDRLKKYRKAGLAKSGEFSVENLVFKYLRNNGYLEKLSECKKRFIDTSLSLEDEEWWKK